MNPCCCCSLRTGGMIIAVLELIGGVIGILISGLSIAGVVALQHLAINFSNSTTNSSTRDPWHDLQSSMNIQTSGNSGQDAGEIIIVILSLIIVLCVAQILFASLLIHGIQRKSVQLMKMWIIFKIMGILFSIGFVLSSFVTPYYTSDAVYDCVSIAFSFYFIWVGVALMKETRTQNSTRVKPTNF